MTDKFHPYTEQELVDALAADPTCAAMGITADAYKRMPLVREGVLLNVRDRLLKEQTK